MSEKLFNDEITGYFGPRSSWETSSYTEFFEAATKKFERETANYLIFMEQRHKVVTVDYIASLEAENKMLKNEIAQLKKRR